MEMIAVRFLKHFDRYNPREVAGFGAELVRQLIERGLARPFDPDEAEVAEAPEADGQAEALAAREAEIAVREAALAEREAALAAVADGAPKKPGKPVQG